MLAKTDARVRGVPKNVQTTTGSGSTRGHSPGGEASLLHDMRRPIQRRQHTENASATAHDTRAVGVRPVQQTFRVCQEFESPQGSTPSGGTRAAGAGRKRAGTDGWLDHRINR